MLCFLLLLVTTYLAVVVANLNIGISRWLLGISLMYILQLSGCFQWTIRQSCEVSVQP